MHTTTTEPMAPTQAARDTARQALAKLLAQSLFNEWLAEQVAAGNIPCGEPTTAGGQP